MTPFADRGPAGRRRLARLLPVVLVAVVGSGCTTIFEGYHTAPNGLPVQDDELRGLLAQSAYDSAWARVQDDEALPQDELLRTMYRGIVAYYAGAYDTAIAALDRAEALAQDRLTASASAAVLSTVTNDRILPYTPSDSERMLLHYYGILAGLSAGDREAAAVEARRLSFILDRVEIESAQDGEMGEDPARDRLRALLHYLSAVAFESYGAFEDAGVSYRRAAALDSTIAPPLPSSDSGDVVVIIERGFVDHLAEENVFLWLAPQHVETLSGGPVEDRLALGALITARVLAEIALEDDRRAYGDRTHPRRRHYGRREVRIEYDDTATSDEEPYLLRVAWPTFRDDGRFYGDAVQAATDSLQRAPDLRADVSSAIIADFSEEKAALLARTVIRSVSRFALGEAAENKAEETSEGLGTLVGILANIGSAAVERADTRSWHLVPSDVSVTRLRLPVGEHPVYAVVEGGGSEKAGGTPRRIGLGRVQVQPGMVTVVSGRIWR